MTDDKIAEIRARHAQSEKNYIELESTWKAQVHEDRATLLAEVERFRAENERLRSMLPPTAHTGVRNGPGEGSWSVFAEKVVAERDAARAEVERLRAESLRSARSVESPRYSNKNPWSRKGQIMTNNNEELINERMFSFETALRYIKDGKRVARKNWNGQEMFIFLVPGSTFKVNRAPLLGIYPEGTEITYHAHIDMKTTQGYIVPWLASQTDLLSNDWVLVDL